MNFKKLFLSIILILLCGGGYFWWQNANQIPIGEKYKFYTLTKGDVTQSVTANGTLNPIVLVSVGSQVSGRVSKLYVDFNDKVKQGQILAELDSSLFDAQVAQSSANVANAKAVLNLAKANNKRAQELFAKEFISKQELDTSTQSLESAKASLDLAIAQHKKDKINQEYTVIRSPVAGVVIDRAIDVGQTVAASLQAPILFKIAQDLRKMQIDTSFAEADIGQIKVGQRVKFSVDAFPNMSFEGKVKQVRLNAITTENVVTYDVVVEVNNPDEILIPGITAYVSIIIATKKDVLLIPNSILRYRPRGLSVEATKTSTQTSKKRKKTQDSSSFKTVYILENGTPKAINIKVGITDNRFSQITTDKLKVGDKIIAGENEISEKKTKTLGKLF
ncbi:MAG: efflux RND transporter periplasmic adaptor subunit [Sulfurospirillaceae bacterium]|nr:efflux RND transporter periplasmic adaptor subunit [Sulfurospirillaceae bacterium]